MTERSKAKLRIVPETAPAPTPEQLLREMIPERDAAAKVIRQLDVLIAEQGRLYVKQRGEFIAPKLERLRRDLKL